MQSFKGRFHWLSTEDNPDFYTTDDQVLESVYVDDVDPPINRLITIDVDDNLNLISYRQDPTEPLGAPKEHRNVALAYVSSRDITDTNEKDIADRAKRVQDHYNRACQGHRTINVDPFVLHSDVSVTLRNRALWTEIRDLIGGYGFYDNLHAVGGGHSSYCGIAWLGGDEAVTFNPWSCRWRTSSHEDGHNDGLSHAGTPSQEYGEHDRIMGTGSGRRWFSPAHLRRLGALAQDQYESLPPKEPMFAWIAKFNTLEMAVPHGAHRAVFLQREKRTDNELVVSRDGQGVTIHEIKGPKTILHKTLKAGETYTLFGRTFEYVETLNNLAAVRIDDPDYTLDEVPVPEYVTPNSPSPFDGKSGAWGNDLWSLQGVHIRHLPDRNAVWVAWLTWDYDYNRVFYWGVLNIDDDNIASGGLRDVNNEVIGTAQMWFHDENNGAFYAHADNELFATPLERVSVGVDTDGGYFGFGNGKGISIERTNLGNTFGYILTKGSPNPLQPAKSDWFMHINGTVYEPEGGMRGVKTDVADEMKEVGTISFNEDNTKLTWDGMVYDLLHLA